MCGFEGSICVSRHRGREVDVKGVVESLAHVLGDTFHIFFGWRHKVNGGDIVDSLSLGINHHVKGDALFPQLTDIEEWRNDVTTSFVINQHL